RRPGDRAGERRRLLRSGAEELVPGRLRRAGRGPLEARALATGDPPVPLGAGDGSLALALPARIRDRGWIVRCPAPRRFRNRGPIPRRTAIRPAGRNGSATRARTRSWSSSAAR